MNNGWKMKWKTSKAGCDEEDSLSPATSPLASQLQWQDEYLTQIVSKPALEVLQLASSGSGRVVIQKETYGKNKLGK